MDYKYKDDNLGYLTFNVAGAHNEFEFKRTMLTKNTTFKIISFIFISFLY